MTRPLGIIAAILLAPAAWAAPALAATTPDPTVLAAEEARAAAMAKASASTVAVFDSSGQGGGSAVLISADGFALTNFHVTAGSGAAMKCGLNDGKLYDAVVVGIDPVGDLALIQLLGRTDFPPAEIGDSDEAKVGDWVFAAGNPFLLADDFHPTISYGIISGVHRYQYPSGTLLEYTDCIQTDAAINPGNSGGPLWDAHGRLIGINGRGSFEKRGRVNVGVGYAISINQAMRFFSHLASGRIVDHASLGATVTTEEDGRVAVDDILETSDAFRRGLEYGDAIEGFAGREIHTANALKNVLGVFPSGWRVPLSWRREGKLYERTVRLMPLHDETALVAMVQREEAGPKDGDPHGPDGPKEPEDKPADEPKLPIPLPGALGKKKEKELPEAVAKRYVERRGYANYWYNREAQQRLWQSYVEGAGLTKLGYDWRVGGKAENGETFGLTITSARADMLMPRSSSGAIFTGDVSDQLSPPRSGGLLLAIHAWQRLVDKGLDRFGEVYYLGRLPHGPVGKVEDCLVGLYEGMEVRFFFADSGGDLTGVELYAADDADPCELTLSDFTQFEGRRLPRRWHIVHGDELFADLTIDQWKFDVPAAPPIPKPAEN